MRTARDWRCGRPTLRGEALARVRHAKRAVDKDLQLAIRARADCAYFVERQFARQRHTGRAELARRLDALGIGDAHLGARVKLDLGRDAACQAHNARVLDDQRVGAGFGDRGNRPGGLGQFVLEYQGVEGNEAFHPAGVERAENLGQFGEREADLGSCREVLEAEVDRIGPGFDSGAELRPVSGRTHDLGFWRQGRRNGHSLVIPG